MADFDLVAAKIILHFILLLPGIYSFNIDSTHPIILTDRSQGASYFGFTVGLLTNSAGSWVLVGAPRGNSSADFAQAVAEPGVIYKCSIEREQCEEIRFQDNRAIPSIKPDYRYSERRNNGWLGVSLDVADTENPNVVACAHLWKNARYTGNWLTNGMCYIIDSELNTNSVKRLLPLTRHSKQYEGDKIYVYGLGLSGFSSHFIENLDDVVLGAPGVYNWKGTIAYSQQPEYNRQNINQDLHVPFPSTTLPEDSYLGYSVSSGAFLKINEIQLVVGAPRDGPAGSVYVALIPALDDQGLMVKLKYEGKQMGEYFGADVCGVDINGDELAELLVGAPLHSKQGEEGIVYLFLNHGDGHLSPAKENLVGSSEPGARFGSAISKVGDLDQDGFNDVAIGAPYEGSGGAVYIYRGGSNGLALSQKMLASDIDLNLRGFGISISKGVDVDRNFYSDLAVGSYDSSHTVVFLAFPVVKLLPTIEFNITKVNLNTSSCQFHGQTTACFMLSACVSYSGKHVPAQLDARNVLSIGTNQRKETRAFFTRDGLQVDKLEEYVVLNENSENCRDFQVHVLNSSFDVFTPLTFSLQSELAKNPRNEPKYCKNCPVSSPEEINHVNKTLPFVINCKDDVCDADLDVDIKILELSSNQPFILGSTRTLTFTTQITNRGMDPAYLSKAVILLPRETQLNRLDTRCSEQEDFAMSEIICDLGNPLNPGNKVKLEILIDVNDLKLPLKSLSFSVNASTTSNDKNMDNNFYDLLVPVRTNIDMAVIGTTDNEQFVLSKDGNDSDTKIIYHTYQVVRQGATPVESVTLEMRIPTSKDEEKFVTILSANPLVNGQFSQFGVCTGNVPSPLMQSDDHSNSTTPHTTISEPFAYTSKYSDDVDNHINLDCSTTSCSIIRCRLGPFTDQELASVKIELELSLPFFQSIIGDKGAIRFITWGGITINDRGVDQSSFKSRHTEIATEFFKDGYIAPKKIAIWIIVLCVITGILILLLIAYVLYKVGFFRRHQKEEMERITSSGKDNSLLDHNGGANNPSAEAAA